MSDLPHLPPDKAGGSIDLESWLEQFLTSRKAANRSAKTIRWYRDMILRFVHWCTQHQVVEVSPGVIDQFLASERDAGLSPATVSARYRALSAFYTWMTRRRKQSPVENPIVAVEPPHVPRQVMTYVKLSEFRQLYGSIGGDSWLDERDRVILLILFWSGLRVSEVAGLAQHDVDVQARLICVREAKGGDARFVPCTPELAAVLLRYLYRRPPYGGEDLLLASDGHGQAKGRLTAEGIRQMLMRRCDAARLRYLNPHAFRHGFAMALLNSGMQMSALSDIMGHSTDEITKEIYAHWLTEGLSQEYDQARARLEKKNARNI